MFKKAKYERKFYKCISLNNITVISIMLLTTYIYLICLSNLPNYLYSVKCIHKAS